MKGYPIIGILGGELKVYLPWNEQISHLKIDVWKTSLSSWDAGRPIEIRGKLAVTFITNHFRYLKWRVSCTLFTAIFGGWGFPYIKPYPYSLHHGEYLPPFGWWNSWWLASVTNPKTPPWLKHFFPGDMGILGVGFWGVIFVCFSKKKMRQRHVLWIPRIPENERDCYLGGTPRIPSINH